MLTWRFAVQLNRSLVELVGLVIEKTEVVYLKSFPCVVVKKTFQVTCGVLSFDVGQPNPRTLHSASQTSLIICLYFSHFESVSFRGFLFNMNSGHFYFRFLIY